MLLLSLNTLIGAGIGAVLAVVSTKVYAFVRKQVTAVEVKAEAATSGAIGDVVKKVVDAVEKK